MDSTVTSGEKAPTFIETARRAQIVAAAIETIAELGYGRASLAQIARRIGVSKGVIAYYFAGKEALEQAVISDVTAKAVAYMQPRVGAGSTGREVLREAILANLTFMTENRAAMIAFFEITVNTRGARGSQNPAVASVLRQGVAAWTELLSSFQKKGEFRPDFDPAVMAAAVRAAIDSVPPRMAADPDFDVEHFGRELAGLFDAATRRPGSRAEDPEQPRASRTEDPEQPRASGTEEGSGDVHRHGS